MSCLSISPVATSSPRGESLGAGRDERSESILEKCGCTELESRIVIGSVVFYLLCTFLTATEN